MKKWLPVQVVVLSVLLLFGGSALAVVMEEPLELEEGMVGITAIMDEPVEYEVDQVREFIGEEAKDVVGVGIEGEVTITAIEEGAEVDAIPEGEFRTTAIGVDGDGEVVATDTKNSNKYLLPGLLASALIAFAVIFKKKKSVYVH